MYVHEAGKRNAATVLLSRLAVRRNPGPYSFWSSDITSLAWILSTKIRVSPKQSSLSFDLVWTLTDIPVIRLLIQMALNAMQMRRTQTPTPLHLASCCQSIGIKKISQASARRLSAFGHMGKVYQCEVMTQIHVRQHCCSDWFLFKTPPLRLAVAVLYPADKLHSQESWQWILGLELILCGYNVFHLYSSSTSGLRSLYLFVSYQASSWTAKMHHSPKWSVCYTIVNHLLWRIPIMKQYWSVAKFACFLLPSESSMAVIARNIPSGQSCSSARPSKYVRFINSHLVQESMLCMLVARIIWKWLMLTTQPTHKVTLWHKAVIS